MRRSLRPAIVLALVGLALTTFPAQAQEVPDLTGVAACVRERGALSVLMLFDESASLAKTDPIPSGGHPQRVVAATALLRVLAGLVAPSSEAGPPQIEVGVASFAEDFTQPRRWSVIAPSSTAGIENDIAMMGSRQGGRDTDFALALIGAQQAMAYHAATAETPSCQVIVLFTDGRYSIDSGEEKPYAPGLDPDTEEAAVIAAGVDFLCKSSGVADQIRNDQVSLITVALAQEIEPADRAFIESLSVSGSQPCGAVTPIGAFFSAEERDGLVRLFDEIGSLIDDGTKLPAQSPTVVECSGGTECVRAERSFVVAPAFSKLHILAETSSPDVAVGIVGPDGTSVRIEHPQTGSAAISGAQASYGWVSPAALAVDLSLPAEGRGRWEGDWKVQFWDMTGLNPSVAGDAQIFVFGGLEPHLIEPQALVLGMPDELVARVLDSSNGVAPLTGLEATLQGTVTDPSTMDEFPLQFSQRADGSFAAPFTTDRSLKASALNVTLTLRVAVSGLELTPVTVIERLEVRPPADYPVVGPASLDFGSLIDGGEEETVPSALIIIEGGSAPGKVCLSQGKFSVRPDGVDAVTMGFGSAALEDGCVRVAPRQRLEVQATLQAQGAGSGQLLGSVLAKLSTKGSSEVLEVEIPVRLAMSVKPSTGILLLAFLVMLVVGLLVPLGLQHLSNRRAARFIETAHLKVAVVPVSLSVEGELANSAPYDSAYGSEQTASEDLHYFETRSERNLKHRELQLEARTDRWPTFPPYAAASAGGRLLVSSLAPAHIAPVGRLPLEVRGSWVFVHDGSVTSVGPATPVTGSLYLIVRNPSEAHSVRRNAAEALRGSATHFKQELSAASSKAPPIMNGAGTEPPRPSSFGRMPTD